MRYFFVILSWFVQFMFFLHMMLLSFFFCDFTLFCYNFVLVRFFVLCSCDVVVILCILLSFMLFWVVLLQFCEWFVLFLCYLMWCCCDFVQVCVTCRNFIVILWLICVIFVLFNVILLSFCVMLSKSIVCCVVLLQFCCIIVLCVCYLVLCCGVSLWYFALFC